MMTDIKIYTSYFAKEANNPNSISIALSSPKYYHGEDYIDLMPTWELVNNFKKGKIDVDKYVVQYVGLLKERKLNFPKIAEELNGRILLCWEKPGQFCHRHIAAGMLAAYAEVIEI